MTLMHLTDPKFTLPLMSAILMLVFRWRRSYWLEFSQHPTNIIKIVLIWGLITLMLWRVFWQLAPIYFA